MRLAHAARSRLDARRLARLVDVEPRAELVELGGYAIPAEVVEPGWICYSGGVGEDLELELALADDFGCSVYAFDPTPRALAYAAATIPPGAQVTFLPCGLWSTDEVRTFYGPPEPGFVSNSTVNLYRREETFTAPCRSLQSLMQELGHERLDLLKLDVEGAEYEVLRPVVDGDVRVSVLCVELHRVASISQMADAVEGLQARGYTVVHLRGTTATLLAHGLLR